MGIGIEKSDKSQFVDLFRNRKSIETVVLLCRKAEQADRHIEVNYEPQGRHVEVLTGLGERNKRT